LEKINELLTDIEYDGKEENDFEECEGGVEKD
jgi:hypothetical protein